MLACSVYLATMMCSNLAVNSCFNLMALWWQLWTSPVSGPVVLKSAQSVVLCTRIVSWEIHFPCKSVGKFPEIYSSVSRNFQKLRNVQSIHSTDPNISYLQHIILVLHKSLELSA